VAGEFANTHSSLSVLPKRLVFGKMYLGIVHSLICLGQKSSTGPSSIAAAVWTNQVYSTCLQSRVPDSALFVAVVGPNEVCRNDQGPLSRH
jgi:hypothetical protein